MDRERFAAACEKAARGEGGGPGGIGTLGEKTLHFILKNYFEPANDGQEAKIGPFVCDIVGERGVVEIQTRGFDRLRKKLSALLPLSPVTVVYPLPRQKWITWMNPGTGECTARRKSPKTGTPCDAFYELYRIRPYLTDPSLTLCIVMLDLEEYRLKNGWSADGKKGSSRCDRFPVALAEEIWIHGPREYRRLLPPGLPEAFTSKDFAKAARISLSAAQKALNVLLSVGTVSRQGKKGRLYLYRQADAACIGEGPLLSSGSQI